MKKSQEVALGYHLSSFPSDKTYNKVIEMIMDKHDDITVWEPFEYYEPEQVVEFIEGLEYTVADALKAKPVTKRKKK